MVSLKTLVALSGIFSYTVAQASPIRYMPFGDSITEITCWRAYLYQQLHDAGYTEIDFVGSRETSPHQCGDKQFDRNHEGHSGEQATVMAEKKWLPAWLDVNPDIVTIHLSTNDLGHDKTVEQTTDALDTLVAEMRSRNPSIRIIVAQIIPMKIADVSDLNAAIAYWAHQIDTEESPVWLVDQYTGYDTATDLRDDLHPNDHGDKKIAARWYPAMILALNDIRKARSQSMRQQYFTT